MPVSLLTGRAISDHTNIQSVIPGFIISDHAHDHFINAFKKKEDKVIMIINNSKNTIIIN